MIGWIEKVSNFFGGHGVSITITKLERQSPDVVQFPISDTVFKGNYTIKSKKDARILAVNHELLIWKKHEDQREEEIDLGQEVHDAEYECLGYDLTYPLEIKAGESFDGHFMIMPIDLPHELVALNYNPPASALSDPTVRILCRVTADVEGAFLDAVQEVTIKVIPS